MWRWKCHKKYIRRQIDIIELKKWAQKSIKHERLFGMSNNSRSMRWEQWSVFAKWEDALIWIENSVAFKK